MTHRLGITMGDPSGVGPEVIVRALDALPAGERSRAVVIGDRGILERAARACGLALPEFGVIDVETPGSDTIRDGVESPGGGMLPAVTSAGRWSLPSRARSRSS